MIEADLRRYLRPMASKKPQSPAMQFLLESLKKDPEAAYADLKAKADGKKLQLFPIMFGRAQAMLGIVKSAKRGTGKFAKARAAKAAQAPSAAPAPRGRQVDPNSKSGKIRALVASGMSVADIVKKLGCRPALVYNVKSRMGSGTKKRGPGRPPKATAMAALSMDGFAGILIAVQNAERDRVRMRAALEKIQAVLRNAFA